VKKLKSEKDPFGRRNVSTNRESRGLALNYRDREKILLAMPLDPAKSGGHEVCSSVHRRLHWVCIANVCGPATALSGKAGATV
jgi:hypothetical protein